MLSKLKAALAWLVGIAGVVAAFLAVRRNLPKVVVPSMPKVDPQTEAAVVEAEAKAEEVKQVEAAKVEEVKEQVKKVAGTKLGSERRKKLAALAKKGGSK